MEKIKGIATKEEIKILNGAYAEYQNILKKLKRKLINNKKYKRGYRFILSKKNKFDYNNGNVWMIKTINSGPDEGRVAGIRYKFSGGIDELYASAGNKETVNQIENVETVYWCSCENGTSTYLTQCQIDEAKAVCDI